MDDRQPSPSPVRVFVLSRRGQGAQEVRKAFEEDREPEPAPYGFNLAEEQGWSLEYSRDTPATRRSTAFFERFEFDFFHALANLKAIRRADIVWTMLEWEWLGVALLQRLRLAPRRPVIANSVWLADKWDGHPPLKRAFLKRLMPRHFDMTLHSRRGHEHLAGWLPRVRWRVTPFGISTRAFPVTPPRTRQAGRPIRIYSIGNDGTRDWETLLEAFGNDPRFEVTVVCRWIGSDLLRRYTNVRNPQVVTIAEQRRHYLDADIVVVPMRENRYSGITVALEAAAMGTPVIAADTGGIDTYFGADEVLFVPPQDPAALRRAALETPAEDLLARAGRAQARFIRDGYDAASMIERYIAATRRMLGG